MKYEDLLDSPSNCTNHVPLYTETDGDQTYMICRNCGSFLADGRPRKDLDDPNHYYNYCNYLDHFLSRISRNLNDQLVEHIVHVFDAERALREYIRERDSLIPQTLSEEMANGRTVLLKIGNAHIDDKYAFLPGYLEKEGIPYHSFFNWQAHTEMELKKWGEIKERVGEKNNEKKGNK